eukprot:Nk52_evm15s2449 gene=Nk52_evmTU15s2449
MSIRNCVMLAYLFLLPVQLVAGSLTVTYYAASNTCTGVSLSPTITNGNCWQTGSNSIGLTLSGSSVSVITYTSLDCSSGGGTAQTYTLGQCINSGSDSFSVGSNSAARVFGQPFLSGPFAMAVMALLTSSLTFLA